MSRVLARAPGRNSPGAALLLPGPEGSATEERMAWVQRAEQALHGLVECLLERERRVAELKVRLEAVGGGQNREEERGGASLLYPSLCLSSPRLPCRRS